MTVEIGYETQVPGEQRVYRAETVSGEQVYVKHTREDPDDEGIPERYKYGNIVASIMLQDVAVVPDIEYDSENGRIVMEDAGERLDRVEEVDRESYIDAVLAKHLVNDEDIMDNNIVVDGDGVCHPIDFDGAGKPDRYKDLYEAVIEDTYRCTAGRFDVSDIDVAAVEERAREMAGGMDFDRIREDLEDNPHLERFRGLKEMKRTLDWFEEGAKAGYR